MLKNEGKVKSIFLDMSSGNKKEFHRTFDKWNHVTKSTVATW